MNEILIEIKSYCSAKNVGKKKVLYFLYWLYCENHAKMKELAYKFGVYHNADHWNVCCTILNALIDYGLLKQIKIIINGNEAQIFKYNEKPTQSVIKYLAVEKNWIELMELKKVSDDF